MEIECENASLVYGAVCWLTCKDNFLMRNDGLEQSILENINDDILMKMAELKNVRFVQAVCSYPF